MVCCLHDEREVKALAQAWMLQIRAAHHLPAWDATTLEHSAEELEFALLTGVLQNRLDHLMRHWREVAETLDLEDGGFSPLGAPEDFASVVPVAPMGNVIAFQYLRSSDEPSGRLRFIRCFGIGRALLGQLHQVFVGDDLPDTNVLLLSATSWAGASTAYTLSVPVTAILRSPTGELEGIHGSQFEILPVQETRVSGQQGDARLDALSRMVTHHARPGSSGRSPLEIRRAKLAPGRDRILLLVGSYQEAQHVFEQLERERPEWQNQIRYLIPDADREARLESGALPRGVVTSFAQTNAWLLIAPLMAIERGHNILNDQNQSAIGAAYFLVRPHPRPDDLDYAVQSINQFGLQLIEQQQTRAPNQSTRLEKLAKDSRHKSRERWRDLLWLRMQYSTLPKRDREAITWNLLVGIWQTIGRLLRGGTSAQIVFVDAAFDPKNPHGSILRGMLEVLEPYLTDKAKTFGGASITVRDRAVAEALYAPFYQALKRALPPLEDA
jgi:hypothetical protein